MTDRYIQCSSSFCLRRQKSKAHPVMSANKNLLVDEDVDVKESARRTQSSSSISQKRRDLDGHVAGAHAVVQTKDWDLSPPLFAPTNTKFKLCHLNGSEKNGAAVRNGSLPRFAPPPPTQPRSDSNL